MFVKTRSRQNYLYSLSKNGTQVTETKARAAYYYVVVVGEI